MFRINNPAYAGLLVTLFHSTKDQDEIVSHMLCHIFESSQLKLVKGKKLPGDCFWSAWNNLDKKDLIPGTDKLINLKKPKSTQTITITM